MLAAGERLTQFLRQATANGRRPAWALRLDVASFLPSIHKATLLEILRRRLRDAEVLRLAEVVLLHDPTQHYTFHWKGRRVPPPWTPQYPVPAQKSLFDRGNERGLPIGNLTSQFWANVYLDQVDQFAKRELGCRWYARYVDDLVLLSHDEAELVQWRECRRMIRDTHLPTYSTNRLAGFSRRPDPAFPVRKVGVLDLRDLAAGRGSSSKSRTACGSRNSRPQKGSSRIRDLVASIVSRTPSASAAAWASRAGTRMRSRFSGETSCVLT